MQRKVTPPSRVDFSRVCRSASVHGMGWDWSGWLLKSISCRSNLRVENSLPHCGSHLQMHLVQSLGLWQSGLRLIYRALMHAGMEKETAQKEYVTLVKSLQEKYAK